MDNNYINTPVEANTTEKKSLKNKKLIIVVGLLAMAVVIIIVFLYAMPSRKSTNNVTPNAEIQLKTEYKNPFDKNAQYDNPFENLK